MSVVTRVTFLTALVLLAACAPSPTYSLSPRLADPPHPQITVLLTVTQDDCCASKAAISYVDPTSGLAVTVKTYYAWSQRLGPFSSLTGDLWLSVDNTSGRSPAHCSIRVSARPSAVTETIPAGQTGACAVRFDGGD